MTTNPMAWEGAVNPRIAENQCAQDCLLPMGGWGWLGLGVPPLVAAVAVRWLGRWVGGWVGGAPYHGCGLVWHAAEWQSPLVPGCLLGSRLAYIAVLRICHTASLVYCCSLQQPAEAKQRGSRSPKPHEPARAPSQSGHLHPPAPT